jgi:hypothetical protein
MAFPLNGVIDNFNRAALGSTWTSPAWDDTGTAVISGSTQLAPAAAAATAAFWTANTVGHDFEAYIVQPTVINAGGNWSIGVFSDLTLTPNTYYIKYTRTGTTLEMWRKTSGGVNTSLKAATSQTVAAGDSVGMARIGATIQMWYKASAGSWSMLDSVDDAVFRTDGWFIGVELGVGDGVGRWDDFGGGSIPASPSIYPSSKFGPF